MDNGNITLQMLIEKLHILFSEEKVNVEEVHHAMSSYKAESKDWEKFTNFDPYRYTRNLVDEGNGKFNLIVLCWSEAQGSCIHDHADAHCFMKILDGQLQESLYGWPKDGTSNEQMEPLRKNLYNKNEVAYINDSIGLHRIENLSHTNRAVSLHLYSPPFESCGVFDERSGKKRSCKVTFWSKYGVRTPYVASSCDPCAIGEQN
eukprot:gene19575-21506_t